MQKQGSSERQPVGESDVRGTHDVLLVMAGGERPLACNLNFEEAAKDAVGRSNRLGAIVVVNRANTDRFTQSECRAALAAA